MPKNLVGRVVGDLYIGVHTKAPPNQEEWDHMLAAFTSGEAQRGLFLTEGGAPTAFQRRQLRALLELKPHARSAILTGSTLVRMAITAINLFNKGLSTPFPPEDINEALIHLQIPSGRWPEIKKNLSELKRELDV